MAEELKTTEQNADVKTYTQDEVDSLLQSESDRRVTEALKKQERKFNEAQKLAQMNENEKHQYELEQREQAIASKEIELARAQNNIEGLKILSERGLDNSLIDIVLDDSADVMLSRINTLDEAFKTAVKAEVEKRLGSASPIKSTSNNSMTREEFKKLSISQQNEIYMNNPELYKELSRR